MMLSIRARLTAWYTGVVVVVLIAVVVTVALLQERLALRRLDDEVADTTEFAIGGSGKLYLAAVLDLFSRFVVGWAVSAVNDRHLATRVGTTLVRVMQGAQHPDSDASAPCRARYKQRRRHSTLGQISPGRLNGGRLRQHNEWRNGPC
jgi:transposase InsO family protein